MKIPQGFVTFVFFIAVTCFAFTDVPVFGDTDTAWHLATGDLILNHWKIPHFDSWSFATQGETWYNTSWLFDVVAALLFSLGGFTALYIVTIIVFAGAVAFMTSLCLRRGANICALALLLLPLLFCLNAGVLARPNMFSVLLTLTFYALLHHVRSTRRLALLWPLPPLMALWINLHGGFLFAYVLIGIFGLEAALLRDRRLIRAYAGAAAACLAASLINPYGYGMYYGTYEILSAPFTANIAEWHPAEIGHAMPITLILLFVLIVGNFSDRRIPLVDRIVALVVLIMGLSSIRHITIAALMMMPYLSLRITHMLYDSRFSERLRAKDAAIARDMREPATRLMAAAFAMMAVVLLFFPLNEKMMKARHFPSDRYPSAAAAFVLAHYPTLHFFNDYNIGGYLAYLWRGKVKYFVDGRETVIYTDDVLKDYMDFISIGGFGLHSDAIASYYGFDGLILQTSSNADLWHANPHWKAVYHDKVATVYLRSELAHKPGVDIPSSKP